MGGRSGGCAKLCIAAATQG